jgi:carboxymethylenebutenolidase
MGEKVSFASNGGMCEGYLAIPRSGRGPAVIVIQEWWGLVGHITSIADRFAQAGFVALAPDLYHGVIAKEPDHAMKMLMGLAMDKAALDIAGAAQYLRERDDVSGKGIGAVGFCMGGSLALWSATLSADITASVAFYPGLPWEQMAPMWQNYLGKSAQIHCSESDGKSTAPGIQVAVKSITAGGGEVDTFDYPGTHHAFFNDDRPEVFDKAASALAWDRMITFFNMHIS